MTSTNGRSRVIEVGSSDPSLFFYLFICRECYISWLVPVTGARNILIPGTRWTSFTFHPKHYSTRKICRFASLRSCRLHMGSYIRAAAAYSVWNPLQEHQLGWRTGETCSQRGTLQQQSCLKKIRLHIRLLGLFQLLFVRSVDLTFLSLLLTMLSCVWGLQSKHILHRKCHA